MGYRRYSHHQLSNGLFVSGPPGQPRERQPTMTSRSIPYTGGDVETSGELGRMFGISGSAQGRPQPSKISRTSTSSSQHITAGPARSCDSSSGSTLGRTNSSVPTGVLVTGPLTSSVSRRSARLEPSPSMGKTSYGSLVTDLTDQPDPKIGFNVSKSLMWIVVVFMFMALMVGAFLALSIKTIAFLVAAAAILALLLITIVWNCCWKKKGLLGFLKRYEDCELRGAADGQCVKVSGVVTCGIVPLETSFQKIPRCVYVSTELYDFRGWTWGCRYAERYVTDFYISDSHSGLRAMVKAGNGSKTAVLVESAKILDVTEDNLELSQSFFQWLLNRSLSTDEHIMRLKEGYIKEGSVISVIGVLKRQDNMMMIVPPSEPISTGCQWIRWLFPTYIQGLVLVRSHDDEEDADVIHV